MVNKKRVMLILDTCYLCPHYEEIDKDYLHFDSYCFYDKDNSIQLTHADIISLSKCKLDEYKKIRD